MKHSFFAIPFFTDKVDLKQISIVEEEQKPNFRSGIYSSFGCPRTVSEGTINHLSQVISKNIDTLGIPYSAARIDDIWRNTYVSDADFQDPHQHCGSQWSFIVYEDVDISRTVFLNPYRYRVESQMEVYGHLFASNPEFFGLDWRPELHTGDIIIFPSFVEHFVLSGGKGSTIAGNVYLSP
tara:strand:+ start:89 stop:631 length:543 start_codon:yes stop_codon:yes gene_type:complete